ncbi:MAG: hypothetical protein JXB85_00890 [Anaerolineales bacterium]|nr:hypothetical protein [Anaerolineales bacterium]
MKRWQWIVSVLGIAAVALLLCSPFLNDLLTARIPWLDFEETARPQSRATFLHGWSEDLVSTVGGLFVLGITGILILYIVPGRVRRAADTLTAGTRRLLRMTLQGFLVLVLLVTLGIGSAVMIGTFPLMILLLGALFVIGLAGFVSLAFALGRGLLRRAGWRTLSPVYAFLLGLLLLAALSAIPLAGAIFLIAFISLGLGAMIASRFGSGESWNLNPLLEESANE